MGRKSEATRVVLVDEEERTVHAILSWLAALGYDVHAFTSPRDAIELVAREGADVVVTAAHVGDTSGAQICATIRERCRERGAAPACIALATASEGIAEGDPAFDGVVRKPCSLDRLLEEISRLVPARTGPGARPASWRPTEGRR